MPPAFMAVLFGGLAAIALWSVQRDLHTGWIRDEVWTFTASANPTGFGAAVAGRLLVAVLCVAEVLHALGLARDPFAAMRAMAHSLV
jgi:hypothetical protein